MKKIITICILLVVYTQLVAQGNVVVVSSKGYYTNPIIHADYSDPDAIRVGNDYYLIASSFNNVPGLPILHSTDLVNWKLIGYALQQLIPTVHYNKVQHGAGVWAPSIRYHQGEFYIYYPDPDFGIYLTKAKNIKGPWSKPILVQAGKGLIDPCPIWDENGRLYLVHAYAGSRAGIKSILVVKELSNDGTTVISDAVMVYDGHNSEDRTVEGPKFYKRNGFYYIFAPAGGVKEGWQLVLRSKNIYGPYERKIVLHQGQTNINGPHQGAWVTSKEGKDWFIHFQDKESFGRIVHLQPMKWENNWPVMGSNGEPVYHSKAPIGFTQQMAFSVSDEFNTTSLGLHWQWQANPQEGWFFPTSNGNLRLFSVLQKEENTLWQTPNILTQKLSFSSFTATAKLRFNAYHQGEEAGLVLLGVDYGKLAIQKSKSGYELIVAANNNADKESKEAVAAKVALPSNDVYLRVQFFSNQTYQFSYSIDNKKFEIIAPTFSAKPGKWVGAKIGLYCNRYNETNNAGYVDIDWWRVTPNTTT